MKSWLLGEVEVVPHLPEIIASGDDARVVLIELPAGDSLQDHQSHERARILVIDGEIEVTGAADEALVSGGPGLLLEFAPGERRQIDATTRARLLLLLSPWPGEGHPGAMSLEDKASVRARAAEKDSAG